MPLPLPKLDNRTFDDLVAEGRSLIPRHAPEWTDFNVHDPGITLLELFAWLTEMGVYRLDRTVDAAYRAFLRAVGVEIRPAQAAMAELVLTQEPGGSLIALPAAIQVGSPNQIVFQTTAEVNVSPAQLVSILAAQNKNWVDVTSQNRIAGKLFQPFVAAPAKGDALYLGFDMPLAGQPAQMSLFVWTDAESSDRTTRERLMDESVGQCEPWWEHYGVKTVWEYHTADDKWLPLPDAVDETRALSLTGAVKFTAPTDHAPGGADQSPDLYFIRCRIVCGKYDCPPLIDLIALNVVTARHAADIEAEEAVGRSTGRAGQTFQVRQTPVAPSSTKVRVLLNNQEVGDWQEVLFWDLVGPHDRSYLLSPETGEITFGDGRTGRVPPADAEILVTYQVGGGVAGNVAAGSLIEPLDNAHNGALVVDWQTVRPLLKVAQPFAAQGGQPAETLTDAQARALDDFARQKRAVSLADFEALALATPGARIARARAIADYDPALPCFPAPGCVTVVVIPCCPDPRPEPTRDLLRMVYRYLDRRRTLTTEVRAIGPSYTEVAVGARLHAAPDADGDEVRALAVETLEKFFHPLTGGPDGKGWPIGRGVYRAEVMVLLGGLPGVIFVDKLCLKMDCSDETCCENLIICPNNLVASGKHRIEIAGRSCCNESA